MKYSLFILAVLLWSCSPQLITSPKARLNDSALIVVECKSERLVESSALLALRTVRYNDLEKQNDGTTMFIKARYQELADYEAEEIKQRLDLIPGVWDVQVIRDGMPAKHVPQMRNPMDGN